MAVVEGFSRKGARMSLACRLLILIVCLSAPFAAAAPPSAAPGTADEARARELLSAQGCKGCHPFEGSGGNLGPDLTRVGERLSADRIREHLTAPAVLSPGTIMPPYDHLSAADLEALAIFLARPPEPGERR